MAEQVVVSCFKHKEPIYACRDCQIADLQTKLRQAQQKCDEGWEAFERSNRVAIKDLERLKEAQAERDAAERERDRFRELGDRVMEERAEAIKRGVQAWKARLEWQDMAVSAANSLMFDAGRWCKRAEAAEGLAQRGEG